MEPAAGTMARRQPRSGRQARRRCPRGLGPSSERGRRQARRMWHGEGCSAGGQPLPTWRDGDAAVATGRRVARGEAA